MLSKALTEYLILKFLAEALDDSEASSILASINPSIIEDSEFLDAELNLKIDPYELPYEIRSEAVGRYLNGELRTTYRFNKTPKLTKPTKLGESKC